VNTIKAIVKLEGYFIPFHLTFIKANS